MDRETVKQLTDECIEKLRDVQQVLNNNLITIKTGSRDLLCKYGLLILAILTSILIPTNGWSQLTFSDSSENKTAIGALYSQYTVGLYFDDGYEERYISTRQITGSFDYRLMNNIKFFLYPSMTFGETSIKDRNEEINVNFPPSPGLSVSVSNIYSKYENTIGYFYIGNIQASRLTVTTNFDDGIFCARALAGGGIGIYRKITFANSGLIASPSFGVFYHKMWYWSYTLDDLDTYLTNHTIRGQAGIEVEVSPNTSIVGLFAFSFQNPESAFTIGIHFH